MEIKVDDLGKIFHGEIVKFDNDNNLILRIEGIDHGLKLISLKAMHLSLFLTTRFMR